MAESTEWLYDAIIRFLQGPLYSGPLMSFIDANCEVFDGEEENKLEYTEVHGKFKALVDDLITGFIAELGVEDKVFMEAVTSQGSNKLNSFVLTSILTVDDFVQFKAMMVKRNTDLTAEVLEMHAKAKGESAADNAAAASSEADAGAEDAELTEALRLSREQFELEKTRTQEYHPPETSEEEALSRAMAESLKETASLDRERAELEQAIALSLALQQEQERLLREMEASGSPDPPPPAAAAAAAAPPPPAPKAAPPPPPPAAPAPPPPAPAAAVPPPATPAVSEQASMSMSGSIRAGSSAGYSSGGSSTFDPMAIRQAAAAAADTQRALVAKRDAIEARSAESKKLGLSEVSQAELQRRSDYLKQQREILVAKKQAQRKAEMEEYKASQPPQRKAAGAVPTELRGAAGDPEASAKDLEAEDDARAHLRKELARHMKQQLMAKQMNSFAGFDARH